MDLQDFIQEVLDNEFPGERKKQEINPTRNGFNFACPFCGDSMKNASAKRGNVYLNSKAFKCFNDGCMTWMPLKKFIGTLAAKHSIDITDLDIDFEAEFDPRERRVNIVDNNIMNFLYDTGAFATMLDLEHVRNRFSLIRLTDTRAGSAVRTFSENRLLFNIPNVGDYIYADNSDKLIYIFNYHKPTGKILSFATRSVEFKKYKVVPYSHICENLHIPKCVDHADALDQLGEYFNILNADLHKPIKVTEGQIDSLFLENACAIQGVTKSMFLLDAVPKENILTMFDRDKAGSEGTVREMFIGHKAFMWSLLIRNMKRKYSPDDPKLRKIKDTNDLYQYLYERTKLPIWRFNTLVDNYFTTSPFDMIYI